MPSIDDEEEKTGEGKLEDAPVPHPLAENQPAVEAISKVTKLQALFSRLRLIEQEEYLEALTEEEKQLLEGFGFLPRSDDLIVEDLDLFHTLPEGVTIPKEVPICIAFTHPLVCPEKYDATYRTRPNRTSPNSPRQKNEFRQGIYDAVDYEIEPRVASRVLSLVIQDEHGETQRDRFIEEQLPKFSSLQKLIIKRNLYREKKGTLSDVERRVADTLNHFLPQLTDLTIDLHADENSRIITLLRSHVLRRLKLFDCKRGILIDPELKRLVQHGHSLEDLSVVYNPKTRLVYGRELAQLPNLRRLRLLDISGLSKSLDGIDQAKLESLSLSFHNQNETPADGSPYRTFDYAASTYNRMPIKPDSPITETLQDLNIPFAPKFDIDSDGEELPNLKRLRRLQFPCDGQTHIARVLEELGKNGLEELRIITNTNIEIGTPMTNDRLPSMPYLEFLEIPSAFDISHVDLTKFPQLTKLVCKQMEGRKTIDDYPPNIQEVIEKIYYWRWDDYYDQKVLDIYSKTLSRS